MSMIIRSEKRLVKDIVPKIINDYGKQAYIPRTLYKMIKSI